MPMMYLKHIQIKGEGKDCQGIFCYAQYNYGQPIVCPHCRSEQCVVHGYYERRVRLRCKDGGIRRIRLRVKRLRCTCCHRTFVQDCSRCGLRKWSRRNTPFDAAISAEMLDKAIHQVVPATYNQLSVDLDTSTNDTLLILANGLAGNEPVTAEGEDYDNFVAALTAIAEHMAALHASDGEGASHLITCQVSHAKDKATARAIAKSVVCSNLFKAAVFGRDANWGRILCAIGYTQGDFSVDRCCVWLESAAGSVYVCENAAYHPYSEEEASKVLAEHDILVRVDMGDGEAEGKAWGCDLTYDYVKINGDYRS